MQNGPAEMRDHASRIKFGRCSCRKAKLQGAGYTKYHAQTPLVELEGFGIWLYSRIRLYEYVHCRNLYYRGGALSPCAFPGNDLLPHVCSDDCAPRTTFEERVSAQSTVLVRYRSEQALQRYKIRKVAAAAGPPRRRQAAPAATPHWTGALGAIQRCRHV